MNADIPGYWFEFETDMICKGMHVEASAIGGRPEDKSCHPLDPARRAEEPDIVIDKVFIGGVALDNGDLDSFFVYSKTDGFIPWLDIIQKEAEEEFDRIGKECRNDISGYDEDLVFW